ncbi:MAG: hypothetical protein EBU08_06185, partial [Micrococcales bacterium]|nr:hypothetical protein [Micrococcales bacterium]
FQTIVTRNLNPTDNAVMLNDLRKAFNIANQANEQGIANFIAERIDMHAKWDWQLKATTTQGM